MLVGLKKGSFLQGRYKRDVNAFTFVDLCKDTGCGDVEKFARRLPDCFLIPSAMRCCASWFKACRVKYKKHRPEPQSRFARVVLLLLGLTSWY